jgi:hypothetical protein
MHSDSSEKTRQMGDREVAKATTFARNLLSYREILSQLNIVVLSMWNHFPLADIVAEMSRRSESIRSHVRIAIFASIQGLRRT